jgi:sterol 3beta-glucosyltransferase
LKVAAITFGTEGDTRPLAALCRALIDAGHEAHLLAADATLASAQALGVPATGLPGDIRATVRGAAAGASRGVSSLAREVDANAETWLSTLLPVASDCEAVIVSGPAAFIGLSAAEHLGLPAIGTGLIPITPTAAFPSPFLPPGRIPAWLNRRSHQLVNNLIWAALRSGTNAARARVCGLPARRRLWTEHPMLYGVSPSLTPRPEDWPANAEVCGQWTLPQPDWSPPAALARFLAAGEPPIYVGFGSMAVADGDFLDPIVAAVAGRRALFYPGWSGVDPARLPGNFLVIGETPHDWLFPRSSLVIHHGGSGTTHSAARAGAPSVVAPIAGDQAFWAMRLHRLGVAPPPLPPARRRRAEAWAEAIAFAEAPAARAEAAALAKRMAAEDGLATAVSSIERLVAAGRARL